MNEVGWLKTSDSRIVLGVEKKEHFFFCKLFPILCLSGVKECVLQHSLSAHIGCVTWLSWATTGDSRSHKYSGSNHSMSYSLGWNSKWVQNSNCSYCQAGLARQASVCIWMQRTPPILKTGKDGNSYAMLDGLGFGGTTSGNNFSLPCKIEHLYIHLHIPWSRA